MRELTITEQVASAAAGHLHAPALTSIGPDGRAELSYQTMLNWAAKTACLLRTELGVTPGTTVEVLLPIGWPAAVITLGAWWAGIGVRTQCASDAEVAFVPAGADADAAEVFVVSGHPLGLPESHIEVHQRHFGPAVLVHDDHFRAGTPQAAHLCAVDDGRASLTQAQVLAARPALPPATRLLSSGRLHHDWFAQALLGPLAVGGSAILADEGLGDAEREHTARVEHITARWP